ncbi:MAG: Uma2 family endonuclease [Gloeomargarita sp. SKYG116]|nr:Uma2 family endonuclease [Gloeomargarita sp. SKYG116]MDW8402333.1 hypothetical protein [Gloeomargarita sp. SKYGB_i_bin116]
MTAGELVRHRFSVDQYHRMIAAGIFQTNVRLELIRGDIVVMSPISPRRAAAVERIAYFLFVDQSISIMRSRKKPRR